MTREQLPRPPRYTVRLGAEIRVGGTVLEGSTRDLSAGGLCVELPKPLDDGAMVDVTLFLIEDEIESPDKSTLGIRARVQWSAEGDRGFNHGMKFDDSDPQKLASIANALRRLGLAG